jgi:SAM-dependent methyltransferase
MAAGDRVPNRARFKRLRRVLHNIVTGADVSSGYPARAVEIVRSRIPRAIRSRTSPTLADRAIEAFWNGLPSRVRSSTLGRALGRWIHRRACRVQARGGGGCYTRFFRNIPQLELLRDLVLERPQSVPLKIVSLGCSTGAELYSAIWLIRMAREAQEVQALGIDSSEACIQAAARGIYPFRVIEVAGIEEATYERLFVAKGKTLIVQDWLKEAVTWAVGDACSSDLVARVGLYDVVVANHFLFNMSPERAAACLKNITRLVAPDGYLVVSGADLEVRRRVLGELGFIPMTARSEEIHAAEDLHTAWPLRFWGLEPLDRTRQDWPTRYATVFRAPGQLARSARAMKVQASLRNAIRPKEAS